MNRNTQKKLKEYKQNTHIQIKFNLTHGNGKWNGMEWTIWTIRTIYVHVFSFPWKLNCIFSKFIHYVTGISGLITMSIREIWLIELDSIGEINSFYHWMNLIWYYNNLLACRLAKRTKWRFLCCCMEVYYYINVNAIWYLLVTIYVQYLGKYVVSIKTTYRQHLAAPNSFWWV